MFGAFCVHVVFEFEPFFKFSFVYRHWFFVSRFCCSSSFHLCVGPCRHWFLLADFVHSRLFRRQTCVRTIFLLWRRMPAVQAV